MKKILLLALLTLGSTSAFAQTVVQSEKGSEDASDACFLRQVYLKGYSHVDIIGKCENGEGKPNGMHLSLVAHAEGSGEIGDRVELGNLTEVIGLKFRPGLLQLTVLSDSKNAEGKTIQQRNVIRVKPVDAKMGTFSIEIK